MTPAGGSSKPVPHGDSAWSHAAIEVLLTALRAAELTIGAAPGESDSGLFSSVKNCGGDELWTNESWLVDGLGTPLRRFRKSHHLIRDRLALIRGIARLRGDHKGDSEGTP